MQHVKYNRNHKGVVSIITYDPLWDTMRRKGITTYSLIKDYSFSKGTLDSLKQNRNISTATLNDLCNILSCRVEVFFVTFQTKYKRRFEDIYCSSQSVVFYICLLAGVTLILSIHSMYKVLLT